MSFTAALDDRGSDLLVREVARLRGVVRAVKAERPFRIDAWVVLPDHLHAVWTLPERDADYFTRWKDIKTRFTKAVDLRRPRSVSMVAKGEAGLWQRRFWEHRIHDEAELAAHVRYCWINPVKHGLVDRPADWPFSSIHRDAQLGRVGPESSGEVPTGRFGEPGDDP